MKKVIGVFFALLLLIPVVVWASGSKESSAATASKGASITFSWWGGEERNKVTQAAIAEYMKLHPGVKITAQFSGWTGYEQKLATELSSGTAPDLIQIVPLRMKEFSLRGDVFANLNDYSSIVDVSHFSKKFLDAFGLVNGKLLGLPTGVSSYNIFYNTNLTKKDGIDISTLTTWKAFMAAGKKVHQMNPKQYLLWGSGPHNMGQVIGSYVDQLTGNNLINDNNTIGFDRQSMIKGFTLYKQMVDTGVVPPLSITQPYATGSVPLPQWVNGNIGAEYAPASVIQNLRNNNVKLAAGNTPVMPGAKQTGILTTPPQMYSINKASKDVRATAQFLNWIENSKQANLILNATRGVPATTIGRQALLGAGKLDPTLEKAVSMAAADAGIPLNEPTDNSQVQKVYQNILSAVGYGKLTPTQATDQLMSRLHQTLASLKSQQG